LLICTACGAAQKRTDAMWHEEAERIYAGYAIYAQSGGMEQMAFEPLTGVPSPRSARLLQVMFDGVALPRRGRLMDIGCGNGSLLHNFAERHREWRMTGTEHDRRNEAHLAAIDGFEGLSVCEPWDVPGTFDLISMVHVLEHFAEPFAVLERLRDKLTNEGLLLIEVPDAGQNPFDLTIADHATHFTFGAIKRLVERAGYHIVRGVTDCIPKEISLLLRRGAATATKADINRADRADLAASLHWLREVALGARGASSHQPFGLFGTAIAANWLYGTLADRVTFFVDEDPARTGTRHLDRPVLHPRNVPPGSLVFVPLAPHVAQHVAARLNGHGVTYEAPPALHAG
jgi:SAM-dependent methyltransferase